VESQNEAELSQVDATKNEMMGAGIRPERKEKARDKFPVWMES